jgi:hypothetical protein
LVYSQTPQTESSNELELATDTFLQFFGSEFSLQLNHLVKRSVPSLNVKKECQTSLVCVEILQKSLKSSLIEPTLKDFKPVLSRELQELIQQVPERDPQETILNYKQRVSDYANTSAHMLSKRFIEFSTLKTLKWKKEENLRLSKKKALRTS